MYFIPAIEYTQQPNEEGGRARHVVPVLDVMCKARPDYLRSLMDTV